MAATVDAVKRHVNDDAATDLLVAYAWTDTDIRKLVDKAGFHAIEMQVIESLMRWPSSVDGAARSPFVSEMTAAHIVMVQEVRAA
jgi:hypothetical protein